MNGVRNIKRSGRFTHWFLIAPAFIYLGLTLGFPLVRGLQLSFTETNTLNPLMSTFKGIDNYKRLFSSSSFLPSLGVTLSYAFFSVIGALFIGMICALIMNRTMKAKFLLRATITLPWAAPPIAVALVFTWIFNAQYGVANYGLRKLGIGATEIQWFDNPSLAMPALILVTVWMTFSLTSLILLAALQSVPKELNESAMIDGASPLKIFLYITIPFIRPTIYVMTLLLSIWALRRFDIIWVLTEGGPVERTTTLVVRLYRESFLYQNLGYGAAIGMVGFVLSVSLTFFYFRASKKVEDLH